MNTDSLVEADRILHRAFQLVGARLSDSQYVKSIVELAVNADDSTVTVQACCAKLGESASWYDTFAFPVGDFDTEGE